MNQELARLEANVERLLAERAALEAEVARLQEANESQRQELIRSHEELATSQRAYKRLQTAYALSGNDEGREQAKRRLTHLIKMIDKAIEVAGAEA